MEKKLGENGIIPQVKYHKEYDHQYFVLSVIWQVFLVYRLYLSDILRILNLYTFERFELNKKLN